MLVHDGWVLVRQQPRRRAPRGHRRRSGSTRRRQSDANERERRWSRAPTGGRSHVRHASGARLPAPSLPGRSPVSPVPGRAGGPRPRKKRAPKSSRTGPRGGGADGCASPRGRRTLHHRRQTVARPRGAVPRKPGPGYTATRTATTPRCRRRSGRRTQNRVRQPAGRRTPPPRRTSGRPATRRASRSRSGNGLVGSRGIHE